MDQPRKISGPDLRLEQNNTLLVLRKIEQLCDRLSGRQFKSPAVTRSVHEGAAVCKATAQECRKHLLHQQPASEALPACESTLPGLSSEHESRLQDLSDESYVRVGEMLALLDHAILQATLQATEADQLNVAKHLRQKRHVDNILNAAVTSMG
jgi:hypothetical protein